MESPFRGEVEAVFADVVVRLAARLGYDGFSGLQAAVQDGIGQRLRPAVERIRAEASDLVRIGVPGRYLCGRSAEQGGPRELRLVADAELGPDALDVGIDSVRAYAEPGGDLPMSQAVSDLAQHLILPF